MAGVISTSGAPVSGGISVPETGMYLFLVGCGVNRIIGYIFLFLPAVKPNFGKSEAGRNAVDARWRRQHHGPIIKGWRGRRIMLRQPPGRLISIWP
jgi:hypothetical protein